MMCACTPERTRVACRASQLFRRRNFASVRHATGHVAIDVVAVRAGVGEAVGALAHGVLILRLRGLVGFERLTPQRSVIRNAEGEAKADANEGFVGYGRGERLESAGGTCAQSRWRVARIIKICALEDVEEPGQARDVKTHRPRQAALIPVERIERTIVRLRGHNVMDADTADLYCVPGHHAIQRAGEAQRPAIPRGFHVSVDAAGVRGLEIANCDLWFMNRFRRYMPLCSRSTARSWPRAS